MDRRRAEVPQDRLPVAGEHRPAAELVALPFADLGRGDVADVVDVEDKKRAEIGFFQCLTHAREPITVETAIVHPLLEIDPHGAERRQRAAPVVARIDVFSADLADRFVHLSPPLIVSLLGRVRPRMLIYSKLFVAAGSPRLHNSFTSRKTTTAPIEAPLGGSQ